MDRSPLVVIGDPHDDPPPTPPPGRRLLGLIAGLVAAGAVWALVANSPQVEPAELEEEAPEPLPSTTVYQSALEAGGGEILLPGSGVITDIAGDLAVAVGQWYWAGSQLWRIGGNSWTYLPSPDLAGAEIASLTQLPSGRYVAAGTRWETGDAGSPSVFVSDNEGQSWSEVSGFPERGGTHYVEAIGGQLVLLGWEGAGAVRDVLQRDGSNFTSSRLWISGDGLTWTSAEVEAPTTGRFEQVIERDGVMLLGGSMGSQARLWTSTNLGLNWHLIEDDKAGWPVRGSFVSVAAEPGGGYVALSSSLDNPNGQTFLWRSPDLQRWTRDEDPSPRGARWIQWGPNGDFLTGSPVPRTWVDQPGPVLFTSADGRSWESIAPFPDWDQANGTRYVDGRLTVFGSAFGQPRAWTWPHRNVGVEVPERTTGRWAVRLTAPTPDLSWSVARAGNGFIGQIGNDWYWSGDGRAWNHAEFEENPPAWIGNVLATSSGILMIAAHPEGGQSVWWSGDGRQWSPTNVAAPPDSWIVALLEQNGTFVAAVRGILDRTYLWTSENGVDWTRSEQTWPLLDNVLATDQGLVGLRWTDRLMLYRSEDGAVWEEVTSAARFDYLVHTPMGLVAVNQRSELFLLDENLAAEAEILPPVQADGYEIVEMGNGLGIRGWSDPVLYYTDNLKDWRSLPLSVEAGMTGTYAVSVGGPGFFVAGYDRGEIKVWEWVP